MLLHLGNKLKFVSAQLQLISLNPFVLNYLSQDYQGLSSVKLVVRITQNHARSPSYFESYPSLMTDLNISLFQRNKTAKERANVYAIC